MFQKRFSGKIKDVRDSVIAICFSPTPGQIAIIGSGFCISDGGKILTAAHVYNQTPPEFQSKLLGMVMNKRESDGLEHYIWLPLKLIRKDDANDIALFELSDYKKTLLHPLELEDSEKVEAGNDVYFIGFPYAANLMSEGFGVTLVVNRGIISNVKQDGVDPAHPKNWFIVDAINNPGNSGCPLIDAESNKVIGIMNVAFRTKSQTVPNLDIREPMHIGGAKPINLAKSLLKK